MTRLTLGGRRGEDLLDLLCVEPPVSIRERSPWNGWVEGNLQGNRIQQDTAPFKRLKSPIYPDRDHGDPAADGQNKQGRLKVLDLPVRSAAPLGKNSDRNPFPEKVKCLFQACQPFSRIGAIHRDLTRPLQGPAHERDAKYLFLGDYTKITGDTCEGQQDIEKARVVGHKDVGLLGIETLQSLDLNPEPGQGEISLGPIGEASMGLIAAGIEQTRQTTSNTPKDRKQEKKEHNNKLVGEK